VGNKLEEASNALGAAELRVNRSEGGKAMDEKKTSCVEPARGPYVDPEAGARPQSPVQSLEAKGGVRMTAQVGKPAPDFEAAAFIDGGFRNIKLSDYRGQWVALCFYPGDFTFV